MLVYHISKYKENSRPKLSNDNIERNQTIILKGESTAERDYQISFNVQSVTMKFTIEILVLMAISQSPVGGGISRRELKAIVAAVIKQLLNNSISKLEKSMKDDTESRVLHWIRA